MFVYCMIISPFWLSNFLCPMFFVYVSMWFYNWSIFFFCWKTSVYLFFNAMSLMSKTIEVQILILQYLKLCQWIFVLPIFQLVSNLDFICVCLTFQEFSLEIIKNYLMMKLISCSYTYMYNIKSSKVTFLGDNTCIIAILGMHWVWYF